MSQPGQLPTIEWETKLGHPRVIVAGVDEVGRGCLAGPVVAGALVLPAVLDPSTHPWIREIQDSKELSPEKRERLAPLIRDWAKASAIGLATVEEIDRINIYHAAHLAMKRAIEGLGISLRSVHLLIDGNAIPRDLPGDLKSRATAVVKGDQKCLSIAAASILAKVWRDQRMAELDLEYPGYGFAAHKGYSTPTHMKALSEKGACAIHRRTFAPVAAALGLSVPESEPTLF